MHKEDNLQIMNDNMELIKDVQRLRDELANQKKQFQDQGGTKELEKLRLVQDRLD